MSMVTSRGYSIDPLGHGRSDKPHDASAYTWQECIDDLIAVIDAEKLGRAQWWGLSRGAFLLQDLAHLHRERVTSAIFGSSVGDMGGGAACRRSESEEHELVGANHYEAFARSAKVRAFVEQFLHRWS